jgi:hypothetical protein
MEPFTDLPVEKTGARLRLVARLAVVAYPA